MPGNAVRQIVSLQLRPARVAEHVSASEASQRIWFAGMSAVGAFPAAAPVMLEYAVLIAEEDEMHRKRFQKKELKKPIRTCCPPETKGRKKSTKK